MITKLPKLTHGTTRTVHTCCVRNQAVHHSSPIAELDMIDSLNGDSADRPTTTEEHGTPRGADRRKSTIVKGDSSLVTLGTISQLHD